MQMQKEKRKRPLTECKLKISHLTLYTRLDTISVSILSSPSIPTRSIRSSRLLRHPVTSISSSGLVRYLFMFSFPIRVISPSPWPARICIRIRIRIRIRVRVRVPAAPVVRSTSSWCLITSTLGLSSYTSSSSSVLS